MRKAEKNLKKNRSIKVLAASFVMVMAVMLVLQNILPVSAKTAANSPYGQSNPSYHYFYNQLNTESKRIYNAMEEMYENDIFARGEDYDLSSNGKVTDAQLETFVNGSSKLIDDYGAARDAFQYDYPDVFYVDFSLLSVRVVMDGDGALHGFLGAGRSDTYLLKGFTPENIPAAVETYEAKIAEILNGLPQDKSGYKTLEEAKTTHIHNYITKHMVYHFEHQVETELCNARTAYDGLIYGEGVCEAYTRSFKALMDRAGIPTVCVYGVYKTSESTAEQHIWNYVEIDGRWYGVDTTQDDPVVKGVSAKDSGKETKEFLLVGEFSLGTHHYPSGIMSPAMFEFKYPELSFDGVGEVKTYYDEDLVVKMKEDIYTGDDGEELQSGTICVSYKGKNYTQNEQEGHYILSRYALYDPKEDKWSYTDWGYITPKYYSINMEPELTDPEMIPAGKEGKDGYGEGKYVYLPLPHVMRAQFAVTDIPPTFKYVEGDGNGGAYIEGSLYYEGDPDFLTVVSEEIDNKWGDYKKPPYPILSETAPRTETAIRIPGTYHFKMVYDDTLVPESDGAKVDISLSQISRMANSNLTGVKNSKLTNITFNGTNTVEFDFTPSEYYADDNSIYVFQITGLVGETSGKKPMALKYAFKFKSQYCSLGWLPGGFTWSTFGQPVLLDPSDLNLENWKGIDPETGKEMEIPEAITDRMFLVAEKMSPAKGQELVDLLEKQNPELDVRATQIYNLDLTLCKCQLIETGQGVRACIGWPEGYDYSSVGDVVFKAYHYVVDKKTGKPTGVIEPITCIATEYGLIIECHSFSPFLIAAVRADTVNEEPAVAAILQSDENGAFYDENGELAGAKGIIVLDESMTGENAKRVTLKAAEGYVVNALVVNNRRIQLGENNTEYTISLDYNTYKNKPVIISAEFISEKVYAQDIKNGFSNDIVPDYPDDPADVPAVKPSPGQSGNSSSQPATGSGSNGSSAQTGSGSGSNGSSAQTGSESGSNGSSVQAGSESGGNGSSTQTGSGTDNNSNSASLASAAGGNEVKSQSKEQTKSGQKNNSSSSSSSSSKTSGSSSGSDLSARDETTAEPQSDSLDSASAADDASSTDTMGVYDIEDEYVEADEDGINEDVVEENNILTFIIIVVAILGVAAVGFGVFVLRIKVER